MKIRALAVLTVSIWAAGCGQSMVSNPAGALGVCLTDRDCSSGQVCRNGACENPAPAATEKDAETTDGEDAATGNTGAGAGDKDASAAEDAGKTSGDAGSPPESGAPPDAAAECGEDKDCSFPKAVAQCKSGKCVLASCEPGFANINENPQDGCEASCTPTPDPKEICDNVDNDCNGGVDDGVEKNSPSSCGPKCVKCEPLAPNTEAVCENGKCARGPCAPGFTPAPKPEDGCIQCTPDPDPRDLCDGVDNDCDPGTADGSSDPEVGQACSTNLSGPCKGGRIECRNGKRVCEPVNPPVAEKCDQTDNNCDGRVDEGNDLCPAGEFCVSGECRKDCKPNCEGKTCGSNGCGGSCGQCPAGQGCDRDGRCQIKNCLDTCREGVVECQSRVEYRVCDNFNNDVCFEFGPTTQCPQGMICEFGRCAKDTCVPKCDGRQCGDNGCGGSCGSCAAGKSCINGQCLEDCQPECVVGTKKCEGRSKVTCEAFNGRQDCGKWGAPQVCLFGQACLSGECRPSNCRNDCTVEGQTVCQTGENKVRKCAVNLQGCLEWQTTNCPAGEICINNACGVCNNTCQNEGERKCETASGPYTVCTKVGGCLVLQKTECPGGVCSPLLGCACQSECQPGQFKCQAGGIMVCKEVANNCYKYQGPYQCAFTCNQNCVFPCSPQRPAGYCETPGERCAQGVCKSSGGGGGGVEP
ncbi:MAG: hypothetical protein GMKNLPBB_03373 [Myxococcota bacterium]|nr:hypothetical protein [Myxococcota bacterium]